MIKVKCLYKFRDGSGKILGYRLQNEQGQTIDTTPDQLKMYVYSNQMHVVNLKLSKDGRLIDVADDKAAAGSDEEIIKDFIAILRYTEKGLGMPEGSINISDKDLDKYNNNKLMQICTVSEPFMYKGKESWVSIDLDRYDECIKLTWNVYNNDDGYVIDVGHKVRHSMQADKNAIVRKIKAFVVKVRRGMNK